MSSSFPYFDIVLWAMIAGFLILRLRALLGRSSHDEPSRAEPGTRLGDLQERIPASAGDVERLPSKAERALNENPHLRQALVGIRRIDPSFDLDAFLEGARGFYSLVLEAFWAGDREQLRPFLSEDVLSDFDAAIRAREEAGETIEGRIVDIEQIKITDIRLTGSHAEIDVRYEAELVAITRDREGRIIAGNPSDTVRAIDIWTLERDLASGDPNWSLVATRTIETGEESRPGG